MNDLSRLHSGIYRAVPADGSTRPALLSGKLHHVLGQIRDRYPGWTLEYLVLEANTTTPQWRAVDIRRFDFYGGGQYKQLLGWFHQLGLPLSVIGRERFAGITGLTEARIRDAMRRPDTANYKPLSDPAFRFVSLCVSEHLSTRLSTRK